MLKLVFLITEIITRMYLLFALHLNEQDRPSHYCPAAAPQRTGALRQMTIMQFFTYNH